MHRLTATQLETLAGIVGDRLTTDPMECRIYGHDVATMPRLIRPLVGRAHAVAVVQPEGEREVVRLVQWAREQGVPLVPRGRATSGYGGVVPVRGGVIVDFWRMRAILSCDPQAETVTVQPGVVWEDLQRYLNGRGLDLCLYPSSAPASTVGGWLAQGGFGYGSFQFGAFPETVVSARLVQPDGVVRLLQGPEVDLVAEACGTTGIITEVTLRVRPMERTEVVVTWFGEPGSLAAAFREALRQGLPLWSVSFVNPTMASLRNRLPVAQRHGGQPRPALPEAYVVMWAYPASRSPQVRGALEQTVRAHGGSLGSDDLAAHEWEGRFRVMAIKRLGPSLIPTEVVVPLSGLDLVLEDWARTIRQPLALEGMVSGGEDPQVTLLGFIPHDERSPAFTFAFGLSLSAVVRATRHGGRPYSTGLYFAHEARRVLGQRKLETLRAFKERTDPQALMNPGKVVQTGALGTFMKAAAALEPVVRTVGNLARVSTGSERMVGAGRRGIPDDVAWYAHACAQCGCCVSECDQFYGRGWESHSPRAKWFFLKEYMAGRAELSQEWVTRFIACTTCEVCDVECPLDLPIESSWMKMRGTLIHHQRRLTLPAFEIMRAALKKERNIWAAYSKDRANWIPEDVRPKVLPRAEVAYFPGCTASFVEQDVAQGTVRLLDAAGVRFTSLGDGEACCGLPMLVAGLWDSFEEILRHNVRGMRERGVTTVVTSCPACWLSWKVYYAEWAQKLGIPYPFQVKHYSEILAEGIRRGTLRFSRPIPLRVAWHDSCHMGRAGGIYDPPREVLRAIPGLELVEMEHNREHAHCCGGVLTLLENPDTGKVIGDVRLREAEAAGAQAVIASCPCCEVQFRITAAKTGRNLPVIDLGHLAAEALGRPVPDPTAYALEQWKTFEAMIWLLKPEAMAGLMAQLLPQMVEAMPAPLRRAMGAVRGAPQALREAMISLMRPLMPRLFPVLMPRMMPKMMPAMLDAVEERVPMPDHMREQMPDLMPMAMERLLPRMLPLVIPHLMPHVVAYLRGGPPGR